jgi:hypothetical protein
VSIDVEQSNGIRRYTTQGGDHSKRNGAIPTQDEQCVVAGQQRDKACNQRSDAFGHLGNVLRVGTHGIRPPDLKGQVTFVNYFKSRFTESIDQSGRA